MGRRHYVGIFLLSMATLLLELAMMRALSVAYWYHFGFLIISTALLAFGVAGVMLTLWERLRLHAALDHALAVISIAFGVVTLISFWLMQKIPFDPFSVFFDRKQLLAIPLYYVIAGAPFVCSGLAIGLLLSRGARVINRLYAADLVGAGLGCAFIVVVAPIFGGAGSITIAAALGFLAACAFGFQTARGAALLGLALAIIAVPFALVADKAMPIAVAQDKRHPLQPEGEAPIYTAWDALSRVDVYDLAADPKAGRPSDGFSIIIDAGAAGTAIPDLSSGVRDYLDHPSNYHSTGLAYIGKPHPNVLVIGSGAGREVLEAKAYGARSITAVEINPLVGDIVSRKMRDLWGSLFEQPDVHLVIEDGRSFIRRSQQKYDVIISMQTMADAAVTSGALTMSETYLFTREAIGDYLDHLTPNGVLLITRPPQQLAKLFATIREVYEERGLGSPQKHLFAFDGPLAPYGHQLFNTGLLFKKSALTPEDVAALTQRLGVGHPEDWFGQSPHIFYSPYPVPGEVTTPFHRLLLDILNAPSLSSVFDAHREDLAPATDDRPFFNQIIRWSSLRPADFRRLFTGRRELNSMVQPVAEVMLVVMLAQAMLIAFALILWPLARHARKGIDIARPWAFLCYFGGLGLGFIMIEVVFIQRFLLFLGQPIYTFAVVLAGLLIFTGIGASLAGRLGDEPRRLLAKIIPALLVVLLVTSLLSPAVFSSAAALALPWRVAIVIALLAPIGLLLGMPFPTGLRLVAKEAPSFVPWAWGINGFFTVIGSIGGSILEMALGFTVVLAAAGACYLAALIAILLSRASVAVESDEWKGERPAEPKSAAPVF